MMEHEIHRLYGADYGHGRTPGEQLGEPLPASNTMLDVAEVALSANPIEIARQGLKLLQNIEARQRLQVEADRKVLEQLQKGAEERSNWLSQGFRYDPSEGVRHIEFTQGPNMRYMQITTAATDGAGFFYLAFVSPLNFDQSGRPDPDTWEQVSAIGGPSLTLPIPLGAPKVYWYSTVRHEGTIYVATAKDALPS